MKFKFLKKAAAFVTAAAMAVGTLAVLPEVYLPEFGIVASASSYSEFSNIPCGMYCKMSLSNGVLTISGTGPMFNLQYNGVGEMYEGLGDYDDWSYYNDYITSCKSFIKEVKFSNSITYIGSYAFSGTKINNVTLPNSLKDIGSYAFSDCPLLTKVTMNKVESIGYGGFSYCPNLTAVTLPNTLKTIGMEAFVCDGLTEVIIPESVDELPIDAFSGMASLKKIVIPANTIIDDYLGLNNSPNVTIYGYKNSSAETFANKYNIPFISLNNVSSDTYTVTWKNDDGTTIYTEKYNKGDNPSYYKLKYGEPVSTTGQTFRGWCSLPADAYGKYPIAEFIYSNSSYDGRNGDITYYAVYGDYLDVTWYNGSKKLTTTAINSGTVPQYTGSTPCDPYGLNRKFLGWITFDNSKLLINTPQTLGKITKNTTYYAVYSSDVSTEDAEMVDYINQHYLSAGSKEWKGLTSARDIKNQLEDSYVDNAQAFYSFEQYAVKLASLNFPGIIDQYSSNQYTAILLDMYTSVEGLDKAQTILDTSALKSEKEIISDLKKILSVNKIGGYTTEQEYYDLANELYKAVKIDAKDMTNKGNANDVWKKNIESVCKKHSITTSNLDTDIKVGVFNAAIADTFNQVGLAINTIYDYINSINTIVAAQTLYNMDQSYRDILWEIYDESKHYSGNRWEITDLQNALMYQIKYHDMYFWYNLKESFKASYDFTNGFTSLTTGNSIGEIVTGTSVNEILSKYITPLANKSFNQKTINNILNAAKESGIKVEGTELTTAVVGKYISALGLGATLGNIFSEAVFDLGGKNDLYYKGKCYAILESILANILDKKAEKLIDSIASCNYVKDQYAAALEFDRVYKMYMFAEANGLKTYGEYEEKFIIQEISESDNILTKIKKSVNNAGTFFVIGFDGLTKGEKEAIERFNRHAYNAANFKAEADFILSNFKCHDQVVLGTSSYENIFKLYNGIKIALVACPVKVNVYDENHNLIGTTSQEELSVKNEFGIYIYRLDGSDANIIVSPEKYTIEIVGLNDGKMDVITGYFNGDEMKTGEVYCDVPVDTDYSVILDVTPEEVVDDANTKSIDEYINYVNSISSSSNDVIMLSQEQIMAIETVLAHDYGNISPKITSAVAGESKVSLKWNSVNDASEYKLLAKKGEEIIKICETTSTSFTAANLQNGQEYEFFVLAKVNGCWTTYSKDCSAFVTPTGNKTISGVVWLESPTGKNSTYNGIKDDFEKTMSDIIVTLEGNGVKLTTKTDSNGNYKFDKLSSGEYTIKFQYPGSIYYAYTFIDANNVKVDFSEEGFSDKLVTITKDGTFVEGKKITDRNYSNASATYEEWFDPSILAQMTSNIKITSDATFDLGIAYNSTSDFGLYHDVLKASINGGDDIPYDKRAANGTAFTLNPEKGDDITLTYKLRVINQSGKEGNVRKVIFYVPENIANNVRLVNNETGSTELLVPYNTKTIRGVPCIGYAVQSNKILGNNYSEDFYIAFDMKYNGYDDKLLTFAEIAEYSIMGLCYDIDSVPDNVEEVLVNRDKWEDDESTSPVCFALVS